MRGLALTLGMLAAGCATPTVLTRDQVWTLAELPRDQSRTVLTANGPLEISGDAPVEVWTATGSLPATPVSDLTRAGETLRVPAAAGAPVEVDHLALEGGQLLTFPQGRKVALTAAIVVGSALIYLVIAAAVLSSGSGSNNTRPTGPISF